MDYIKGLKSIFSQGSSKGEGEDDGSSSSSSSDDDSKGGGNDNDGAPSSSKTVTFMEAEPSSSDDDDDEGGGNNATKSTKGRMMDSMAYLTQPDQEDEEESSHDQEEGPSSSSSSGNKKHIPLQWNSPDVPSKRGELRRARKQCGDSLLTQLQPSPEGRQHSSTIKSKKPHTQSSSLSAPELGPSKEQSVQQGKDALLQQPPSLSQSVVHSPLRSPSPLTIMSPQEEQTVDTSSSSLMDNNSTTMNSKLLSSEAGNNKKNDSVNTNNVSGGKDLQSNHSHINVKNADPTIPTNDVHKTSHVDDKQQHAQDIIDFGTSDQYNMNDEDDDNKEELEQKKKKQKRLIHKMNIKKQAIYRSLLHLGDNSYSFVYNNNDNNESSTMNDDDEPGLPYIGPDLKEDYVSLRNMLRKGLLGITDDNDDDEVISNNGDSPSTKDDDNVAGDSDNKDSNNPFLPKIKSNVAAVLMGPRGHGKTLVLERCLASLSRLAAKRKERIMEQVMMKQQRQQQSSSSSQQQAAEEMYSQASFRVVRLNGLLFQGDSAVTCTREIARQIGVMSREERKRTRRIMKQISTKRKFQQRMVDDDLETPKASSCKRQRRKDRSSSNIKNSSDHKKKKQSTPLPGLTQTPNDNTTTPNNSNNDNNESHDLRIRRSGFNTYIALLDEVLRTARIDGIPILIILEELQAFLASGRSSGNNMHTDSTSERGGNSTNHHDGGSNDRQLLLYHLLDRVADHKFLVSIVGLTTDLTAVTKLEKRVQSRAEGTSKVIYLGHNKTFDDLGKCLLGKFYTPPQKITPDESNNFEEEEEDVYDEQSAMIDVREEVNVILSGGKSSSSDRVVSHQEEENDGGEINDCALVQRVLKRNYSLIGSDMRWVCRVFDVALSLLVSDIDERIYQCMDDDKEMDDGIEDDTIIPSLSPSHVARALVTMNASMDDVSATIGRPGIPTQGALELIRWGKLLGDPKHYSCLIGTHPRLVALLDLSGPQVAVLLAARRIEARDDTRANSGEDEIEMRRRRGSTGGSGTATATTTSSTSLPLTYQRIEDEYITSFVASGRYTISSDRYPKHALYRSCMDLMEMDIIRLKKDICGGGALQYGHNDILSSGTNMAGLPLFVNLDYELEFMPAVKANLLHCSTALREWGMKMN